jgi:hypothetical protein
MIRQSTITTLFFLANSRTCLGVMGGGLSFVLAARAMNAGGEPVPLEIVS